MDRYRVSGVPPRKSRELGIGKYKVMVGGGEARLKI